MTGENPLMLTALIIVLIAVATIIAFRYRHHIKLLILKSLDRFFPPKQPSPGPAEQVQIVNEEPELSEEEKSEIELQKVQKFIRDRKRIAWKTDISYHLWNLYKSHFRNASEQSLAFENEASSWYKLKILKVSNPNFLNKYEFELNGASYTFIDDEEQQGWRVNVKLFSLFLYDDSDRCLIEIPMMLRVDGDGKNYSISSDSPHAFLLGDWIKDFINATLKQQSIRNQEIRAQKHQERLWEIEDLKDRFGMSE